MTQTAAPAPATKPRQRRADAYCCNVKVQIPLNMSDADSLSKAIKAVQSIKDQMPQGSTVSIQGALGKMAAA